MNSHIMAIATIAVSCAAAIPAQDIYRATSPTNHRRVKNGTASVTPTSLVFSALPAGTTSPAQTVTLTNTGPAQLSINGISTGGANAGAFGFTTACGSSLAVGASCTIG